MSRGRTWDSTRIWLHPRTSSKDAAALQRVGRQGTLIARTALVDAEAIPALCYTAGVAAGIHMGLTSPMRAIEGFGDMLDANTVPLFDSVEQVQRWREEDEAARGKDDR